jgi:competence protein ComEA
MNPAVLRRIAAMTALSGFVVVSAAVVSQGQVATQARTQKKAKAAAKVALELNTATLSELEALPGVGEATAKKIIAGRPYTKVDDLAKAEVPAHTIEGIRALVHVVPTPTGKMKKAAVLKSESGKVNINTADQATLEKLPGIGAATAREIIAGRPFKSLEDLDRVPGLGQRRLQALQGLITFEGSGTSEAAAPVNVKKKMIRREAARPAATAKAAPGQKVNINTATLEELDVLPGIGPVRAQAILDARKNEPFKTIEDIMKVKGIKEGEFGKIKDLITVK